MSFLNYFGKGQTPVNKQVMATNATTTAIIWTPGASNKQIVMNDFSVIQDNTGTIRLYFWPGSDITVAPTLVWEGRTTGSNYIQAYWQTPKVSPYPGGSLGVVTGANGFLWANLGGFEF